MSDFSPVRRSARMERVGARTSDDVPMRRGRALVDRADADRAIGFIVAAAAPFALAVQGGGYDIVARQFTSLAIWWLIAVALAFRALPRARPLPTMRLPAIGLVVLAAWTAASLLWTSSAE